jgi:hypothetical protein
MGLNVDINVAFRVPDFRYWQNKNLQTYRPFPTRRQKMYTDQNEIFQTESGGLMFF